MRLFQNPLEMTQEVERDLFEMGHRYQTKTVQAFDVADNDGFQTIELFPYCYQLLGTDKMSEFLDYMGFKPGTPQYEWLVPELLERTDPNHRNLINGHNPGSAWRIYADLWEPMLRKDGKFSYTYAERWQAQLPHVIKELKEVPETRQAMMTMYDDCKDRMNWRGHDRVPCSVSYQFAVRNGQLDLVYNQRSCDFINFFAADVFFTTGLQRYVAEKVGVSVGTFTHFIGSLHAFHKDLKDRNIF